MGCDGNLHLSGKKQGRRSGAQSWITQSALLARPLDTETSPNPAPSSCYSFSVVCASLLGIFLKTRSKCKTSSEKSLRERKETTGRKGRAWLATVRRDGKQPGRQVSQNMYPRRHGLSAADGSCQDSNWDTLTWPLQMALGMSYVHVVILWPELTWLPGTGVCRLLSSHISTMVAPTGRAITLFVFLF